MNIDSTKALTPVHLVRQPVLTIERKDNPHFRLSHNLRGELISDGNSQDNMDNNHTPYDKRLQIPAIKGRMVDVYV